MAAAGAIREQRNQIDSPAHLDAALDRFGPPAATRKRQRRPASAGKGVVVTATAMSRAHELPQVRVKRVAGVLIGPEHIAVLRQSTVLPRCRCCRHRTSSESVRTTPDEHWRWLGAYAPLPVA